MYWSAIVFQKEFYFHIVREEIIEMLKLNEEENVGQTVVQVGMPCVDTGNRVLNSVNLNELLLILFSSYIRI